MNNQKNLWRYMIANIPLDINYEPGKEWQLFYSDKEQKELPEFLIEIMDTVEEIHGIEYYCFKDRLCRVSRVETEVMLTDKEWKKAIIMPPCNYSYVTSFFLQMFYTHAVKKQMLQMHSSLINIYGYGLMFLGSSGIGKTTQAELWNKYREAVTVQDSCF